MATRTWTDMFGNWRAEFPSTGLDITDHEYAVTVIRAAMLEREWDYVSPEYIPAVRFVMSYQGKVEFTECDESIVTTN